MKFVIFVGILTTYFLISTITGTLVWLLWDNTIPELFGGLVQNGYIAKHPEWFDVVKFSWIVGMLVGSARYSESK